MKQYDMLRLFSLFIRDSKNGKRKQQNGNRIKSQTTLNYEFTLKLLAEFQALQSLPLHIRHMGGLGKKEHNKERTYWSKFAQHFTDFLYNQGLLDNTAVAAQLKTIVETKATIKTNNEGSQQPNGDTAEKIEGE